MALSAAEREAGWRIGSIRVRGSVVSVELEQVTRPLTRAEIVERIRAERQAGASFRQIGRRLERDRITAPMGGPTWHPSTVRDYAA